MDQRTVCCKSGTDLAFDKKGTPYFCVKCGKLEPQLETVLSTPQEVEFTVTKIVKWDNWGRFVNVFRVGDKVRGRAYLYENGDVGSVWAESTIHEGVSDSVDLNCITIASLKPIAPKISEDIDAV